MKMCDFMSDVSCIQMRYIYIGIERMLVAMRWIYEMQIFVKDFWIQSNRKYKICWILYRNWSIGNYQYSMVETIRSTSILDLHVVVDTCNLNGWCSSATLLIRQMVRRHPNQNRFWCESMEDCRLWFRRICNRLYFLKMKQTLSFII